MTTRILINLLTAFTCFLLVSKSHGQDSIMRSVTIASPNAASLGKYGDVPVNKHTGIPSIGLPIYTVKDGPLELPINLSYHASGLKVMEPSSWVGAGWSLNAGGMITRQVVGQPDDRGFGAVSNVLKGHYTDYGFNKYLFVPAPPPGSNTGPPSTNDNMQADDAQFRQYFTADGEPDMFTFNFGGYSGKFYFRDDRTPILVPEQDFRIEPSSTGGVYIDAFKITTPDGTKYYFGKNTVADGNINAFEVTDVYTTTNGLAHGSCISSWFLNKIESVDNNFSMKLTYATESYSYNTIAMFPLPYNDPPEKSTFALTKNYLAGVRLSQIIVSDGTVTFVPGAVRTDLSDGGVAQLEDVVNASSRTLGAIEINNNAGFCKKFQFDYSYFEDNSSPLPSTLSPLTQNIFTDRKRLKLNQVQESSCDATTSIPPHVFSYIGTAGSPLFVPRRLSFGQDHWGFANGVTTNVDLVPTYIENEFRVVFGADREAKYPAMSYGTLSKITYPTGGFTEIEYEANSSWVNYSTYNPVTRHQISVGYDGNTNYNIPSAPFTTNAYQITVNNMACPTNVSWCSATASVTNLAGTVTYGYISAMGGQTTSTVFTLPAAGQYRVSLYREYAVTGQGASVSIVEREPVTVSKNEVIGGLRVKKITNNDGVDLLNNVVSNYDYNDGSNGHSFGILYSKPVYVMVTRNDLIKQVGYVPQNTYQLRVVCNAHGCTSCDQAGTAIHGGIASYHKSSGGILPLATSQGNHIGYGEVKVSQPGNGYSIYRFHGSNLWDLNTSDIVTRKVFRTCAADIPNWPVAPVPFEFMRGEPKYEGHFKEGGGAVLVKSFVPLYIESGIVTPAMKSDMLGLTLYDLKTSKKVRLATTTMQYAQNGIGSATFDTLFYGSSYHNQVTRKTSKDARGILTVTDFKYASDFRVAAADAINDCTSAYNTAVTAANYAFYPNLNPANSTCGSWNCDWILFQQFRRNLAIARNNYVTCRRTGFMDPGNSFQALHTSAKTSANSDLKPVLEMQDQFQNVLIEGATFREGKLISAAFNKYSFTGSFVYPYKTFAIPLAAASTTFIASATAADGLSIDSRYVEESSYKFNQGNLVEVKGKDGIATSYIWGYNNRWPIVQAVGIDFNTLSNAWTGAGASLPAMYSQPSLSNSVLKTFLYHPMVGISVNTDNLNRKTNYEYDAVWRLTIVRDHDNNILKRICYNYFGQIESCGFIPIGNQPQSGQFTKTSCADGGIGSTFTYTIAANTYYAASQAGANQLAMNAVASGGQAFANSQSAGCLWYNDAMSNTFTKQCVAPATGSSHGFTIAANLYSSTAGKPQANALASAALATQGQANANTVGTCTSPPVCIKCVEPAKKCINGTCYSGVKVYTGELVDANTGYYTCVYHYEYPDNTWSDNYYDPPTPYHSCVF